MPATVPFLQERLCWPQQALEQLKRLPHKELLARAILLLRSKQLEAAEATLLAAQQPPAPKEQIAHAWEQLAGLRISKGQLKAARDLLQRGTSIATTQQDENLLQALHLQQRKLDLLEGKKISQEEGSVPTHDCPLSQLHQIQEHCLQGDRSAIQQLLNQWPEQLSSPEALELKARLLKALDQNDAAMAVLNTLLSQSPGSAGVWQAVLELNYITGRSNGLALATAARLHPRDPVIATHGVLIELADRRPGQGRRSAFRERLLYSLGKPCPSRHQSDGNLLYAYDHTGRSDLIPTLHPSLQSRLSTSPPLHANLISQLASIGSPAYGPQAEQHAAAFPPRQATAMAPRQNRSLRVGLISPDLYYHPVGRFVQMLLSAGFGEQGELHLISTGKPPMPPLQKLAAGRTHDFASQTPEQRLERIRALQLDVAVDLAGWTGDNNGLLFASGLAPLQVNYLGYYASSGLPAMDCWLGDHSVFPEPMQEWHSERIVRLQRPFLAWKPDTSLPEGRVEVPPPPQGPITFGCFNHVRKLSAATLGLWARLLKAIPGARLALKAFTSDDPAVVALVERRMRRCGLDPTSVIWLPSPPKPEDHLRQYGLIDVALDPFPNGGCTTTCEALWMGVPVITLRGSHYVSRMATAVLQGANLPEWVARSEDDYLQIGQQAASRLTEIRNGRQQLRSHLQASPLGDASDLAVQLWQCLEVEAENVG